MECQEDYLHTYIICIITDDYILIISSVSYELKSKIILMLYAFLYFSELSSSYTMRRFYFIIGKKASNVY